MRNTPMPPRRQPLRSVTPLRRFTVLQGGGELERRTPLRPRSAKLAKVYRLERIPLVRTMLAGQPLCLLNLPGCTGLADTVHELLPRGRGGSITDPDNCVPACRTCNDNASNAHIAIAQERGLLRHSWDRPDGGGDAA